MKTIDLGEVCYFVRKKRNISQENLIYGICKQSTYSLFEKNEMAFSKIFTERLLQRLGLSSSEFVFLISQKEYEYLKWQSAVMRLVNSGENAKALELLQLREPKDEIQKQFQLFVQGYLMKNLEDIEKALLLTLPRINQIYFREISISSDEMLMLLFYWEREGRLLSNVEVLKGCIEYTDLYYADIEKVKLFSYELDIMRQMKLDSNDKMFFDYFALRKENLMRRLGMEEQHFFDFCLNHNYLLMNEYIKKKRIEREYTQESLCDGICSPVTYSRFESGKQEMSKKYLMKVFCRLGLEYGTVLVKDHWRLEDIV